MQEIREKRTFALLFASGGNGLHIAVKAVLGRAGIQVGVHGLSKSVAMHAGLKALLAQLLDLFVYCKRLNTKQHTRDKDTTRAR